ncbi:MAG: alpha/beta fold hydrolase [Pseudomonadota bacterium]
MAILRSGDVDIYQDSCGSGPPLLFINGFGPPCEWIETYYLPHFKSRFACAWFDLRSVGRSSASASDAYDLSDHAADAACVMDEMGWQTAHVWGASMGAAIALQLAADKPGRVRSMAICAADSGMPEIFQERYRAVLEARRGYMNAVASQNGDPEGAADRMLAAYFSDPKAPESQCVRAWLVDVFRKRPIEALMPSFDAIARMDIPADLPEPGEAPSGSGGFSAVWQSLSDIRAPLLLLQGFGDTLVHRDAAYFLLDRIERIELRVIKPTAHSFALSPEQLDGMADWICAREAEWASSSTDSQRA